MIVHVASFSPADDRAAIGGHEWRFSLDEAKEQLATWLSTEDGTCNLSLVHLEVPDGLGQDQITEWINRNLHLVEPASHNTLSS